MKILIYTIGSRGDVQPFLALGTGLTEAGHQVTVCTSYRYESRVREHGLGYAYLSDDLIQLLDSAEGGAIIEDMGSLLSGIQTGLRLLRETGPIQQAMLREGWEAAREVRPDLIVYHPKMAGSHYAEKLGVPDMLALLVPQFVPTAAFPALGFPRLALGAPLAGWYNRATYWIVHQVAKRIGRKNIAEWRDAHALPSFTADLLHRTGGTRIPVLHAFSQHVVTPPPDWPADVTTTGYWFLDNGDAWEPPAALAAFLDAGEPPVYVGFGSMSGRDPRRLAQIVVDALRLAGLRGVLASGWGGLAPAALPETILPLDQAPHDWLFPRVAAVVHHGGAGTTAAGLRAGRPTVVCPFFGDQPFWGRRVHELGVGPAPIPQRHLTADRLAAALLEATKQPSVYRRADALGTRIRAEDGVANAVAAIERVGASQHRHSASAAAGV